jgi:hypothetical protein
MQERSWSTLGAICGGALALAGVACSTESTRVTDTWKDPSYSAGPMKNIVVFAARLNETQRRTLEDGFVSALSQHTTHATQSYKVFTGALPAPEAAHAMLQQSGFDGVLVATLRGVNDTVTDIGSTGFWGGYYGPGWGEPYVVTEPVVKFETSLWDPSRGKLVWSAVTQTDNPSSGKDFTVSLTKQVVPMLEKAGFISKPAGQPVSFGPARTLQ